MKRSGSQMFRSLVVVATCALLLAGAAGKSDAAINQNDSFAACANHDLLSNQACSNWTVDSGLSWCTQNGGTPSTGPGPSAGNPDPYLYHEASAASADVCQNGFALGDTIAIVSNSLDAGANIISLSFEYNMNLNTSTDGCLHLDVNDGVWNNSVTDAGSGATDPNDGNSPAIFCGNGGDVWTSVGPIDIDALGFNAGNIQLRLRFVTGAAGTSWHYDYALDNIQVTGVDRCSPGTMTFTSGSNYSGNPIGICGDIALTGGASVTNVTITEGPVLDDNFDDASVDAKWTKTDIGGDATPAPTEAAGTLTLSGAGADIWGTDDQFTFLSQPVSGDFDVQVHVPSRNNTTPVNAWFKAGLMARQNLNTNSVNVANLVTESNGVTFQERPTAGATSVSQADAVGTTPKYLRLTRVGNTFRAYWKNNFGDAWTENTNGPRNITMTDPVYIGLAVTSHDVGNVDSATFDDFIVSGAGTTLYNGAACSGIDMTGWTTGVKNVSILADDGCGGPVNDSGTINFSACTDTDIATLTTTAPTSGSTVGNVYTIQTQVGTETSPDLMQNMSITVSGSSGCDVSGAAMTWNAGTSRWEYNWDTSPCGTSAPETGVTIDVSGTDPDCGAAVSAPQITNVTIDNTCTETGTVSVSLSPDPGAGDITGATTVTAVLGGGASNGLVRWREDGGAWSPWVASGSTYTPAAKTFGSVEFEAQADGNCPGNTVMSVIISRNYDSRVDDLEPTIQEVTQFGLTSIRVRMVYCNDKNNTGTFQVDHKLQSAGSYTIGTPTTDGGAGDQDGSLNEEVIIIISGLTTGETYDVRMTYIESGGDSIIGTDVYSAQITLIAWTDQPMLHNSNRFAGTTKHSGDWGTSTGYAGGIQCITCHEGNPTNGNIKRVKTTISFPDGSTMPGGGISANVVYTSAVDGSSDMGNDSGAPRSASNRVCEVCHTYDPTGAAGTQYHAADQGAVSGHYDSADCVKCHEHNIGFKASCDSCHASPPIDASGLVVNGSTPADATGSATAGRHVRHANEMAFDCTTCHTGWDVTGQMPNGGNLNIGFVTPGTNGGTYDGRAAGSYTPDGGTGTSVTAGGALTCNLYCHGYDTPAWNDADTVSCGGCHGEEGSFPDDRAGAPTGGTSLDLAGANSGNKVGKHANHLDDSIAQTGDPCLLCHPTTGHAGGLDGTVDVSLHSSAGVSANYSTGSPGNCSNMDCHSDAQWDSAATGGCNFCHGYPPNSTNNSHAIGVTAVNHDSLNITPNHDQCSYCHGYKDNGSGQLAFVDVNAMKGDTGRVPTAADHNNGSVTMNGDFNATAGDDAGYNAANGGCDSAACHANDASHRVGAGNTGSTIALYDIGPGSCGTCHDTGVGGAPVVTSGSSHVSVTRGAPFGDCTDCHTGHTSASGGVNIANNNTVGINYTASGHNGIKLGGPGTHVSISGQTTEAQICWGCHDNDGSVSEWGVNNRASTGSITYNYGSVTTSNWTTATWTSGNEPVLFSYKTGPIQSTHSASSAGSQGMDAVGNIRCSYCHDVHDLNYATHDSVSGAPYLRGEWRGNPYKEDGAPRQGTVFTSNVYGRVPRASASTTMQMGGYWIDQNTDAASTPDGRGWTPMQFGGLCEMCHANNDGAFTAAEIGSLGGTTGWVSGLNGHANSVKGAAHTDTSAARNIFNARGGTQSSYNGLMAYSGDRRPGDAGDGLRGMEDSFHKGPKVQSWSNESEANGVNSAGNPAVIDWDNLRALDLTGNTVNPDYHHFSCSKCHNPHASRLPRLMITNCLDTKHNTWDNGGTVDSNWSNRNLSQADMQIGANSSSTTDAIERGGTATIPTVLRGTTVSNWTTAQNCHRLAGNDPDHPDDAAGQGAGWNTVTPW